MLVFVDESGDTGLSDSPSASDFFVVVAVIFPTVEEAQKCSVSLDQLRSTMARCAEYEFKFSKLKTKERLQLLKTVAPFDFKYCAVVLDKKRLDGRGFSFYKSFYKFPIRLLFTNAKRHLTSASVCIDRSGNDEFREELEKYLIRRINGKTPQSLIKSVSMEDSRSDNLLQLADIICGTVSRTLNTDKSDYRLYRPVIIEKEASFQKWPLRKQKKKVSKSKKKQEEASFKKLI